MIEVTFVSGDGSRTAAHARAGETLLRVAQTADMPLEGTCEGQMACSTCHVIIAAEWFGRLTAAGADEEDMLDLAAGVTATSRLSCQITLDEAFDGLVVQIPGQSNNMLVR